MKVVVFRVDKPAAVEEIDGELKTMQEIVGGYIQPVPLIAGLPYLAIVDEEGLINDTHLNRIILRRGGGRTQPIFGDFFVCKEAVVNEDGEEDLVGLTDEEAERILRIGVSRQYVEAYQLL